MPDLGDLATQVIAGLIVLAVGGVAVWLWTRRRRPLDWAATGKAALERRRHQIAKAGHDQLVDWVLQRAKVLLIEVPAAVTHGPGFVTVTFHPSGDQSHYFHDLAAHHEAMTSGRYPHRRTFFSAQPKRWTPVRDWSDKTLRSWLDKHADQLPVVKVQS